MSGNVLPFSRPGAGGTPHRHARIAIAGNELVPGQGMTYSVWLLWHPPDQPDPRCCRLLASFARHAVALAVATSAAERRGNLPIIDQTEGEAG